jgi:uncharacterized membrane protein YesL
MKEQLAMFRESLRRFLSVAGDLILLNFLVILCCLPVVTAGASWTAGYACLMRTLRGEDENLSVKPFFTEFKNSFRVATLSWLLLLLCLAIVAGDYYFAVYVSDPVNRFFLVFSIIMAVVLLMAAVWLFPLIARFENTVRGHIKNAFLMAVGMFPKTLLAFAVQLLFLGLPLLVPDVLIYVGWFWLLFGFTLPMYITASLFRKPLQCELAKSGDAGQD